MDDCLFCKFVSGEISPDVVFEDEQVLAFRDIEPRAPVHVLVIPKRHIRDATTIEQADSGVLVALFGAARIVAEKEGVLESGYRLIANVGPDAGQSVLHLHVHVLGGRALRPPG